MTSIANRLLTTAISALLAGLLPLPAHAAVAPVEDSPEPVGDDVQAALAHFNQGIALYEEGDFASALFEFQRAHDKAPDYRLLYNIGVTHLAMRDYAGAQLSLQGYVDQGGDEIDPQRRAEVQSELQTLEARVGLVSVQSDVEESRVSIDGKEVGTTPLQSPIHLNLGTHQIEVSAPGRQTFTRDVAVTGGTETIVEAHLEPIPLPVSVSPLPVEVSNPPPSDSGPPSRVRPLKTATWVMMGSTGALGIGAIVTGALAVRAKNDLQDELARFPADPAEIEATEDRRSTLARTTDGLIAGTATLAAVTLGLGIAVIVSGRNDAHAPSSRARVRIEPMQQRIRF